MYEHDVLEHLPTPEELRIASARLPPLRFSRFADSLGSEFTSRVKGSPSFHKTESRRQVWVRTVLKQQSHRHWEYLHPQYKKKRRR